MSITLSSSTFYLSRIIFLRALALVYSVAFFVAYTQNPGLIGDHGITPARRVLDSAQRRGKHKRRERQEWLEQFHHALPRWKRLLYHDKVYQNVREKLWDRADRLGRPVTTVLWLCKDRSHLNPWLNNIALVGMTFSLYILFKGAANVPLLLTCWICQRSLMAVGGCWYGYGWEPQLAELGFHALFLVPFLSLSSTYSTPPPLLVIYSIRWYLFKIMMGAGLIKLKSGDWKWKDLSAMDSFYETQPVPNPLSKYFHLYSNHKLEVLVNHVVEVICPFLLLVPQTTRAGGLIQIAFQVLLILSGNLSFLNWLTMVPAFLCLDDAFLSRFFSSGTLASISAATPKPASLGRRVVTFVFVALIARLNIPVIQNLLAKRQLMNASFDPLRLVCTYGAFGSVNDYRNELVVTACAQNGESWKEYEFHVKPGNIWRRPRWISPYHYRLDWQMWIAATIGSIDRSPWIYNFLLQLLERNKDVTNLLEKDPFADTEEPAKYICVHVYRYSFHKYDRDAKGKQPFWDRKRVGQFYPRRGIATVESLKEDIKSFYYF
jgi:uncharacterized membrane protein YphA (DoxX/SURF4 family)